VKDLAEGLKTVNTELNSVSLVCYLPDGYAKYLNENIENKIIMNLLRREVDHIFFVTETKVAEELKLEESKFYTYYKPSYINNFEDFAYKDINLNYI
jgi:hypothetical protein